ncbi:hypothetical protein Pmi06nite_78130 [Planotetraspora mira]|uniref:Coenzyme Q-binding protein COQ10 START domain-containing protein n=2 Tax=Planotetraspora mira TaxID=58121 RepID=A0A8J3XBA1_9ACTN|nr:hypothetical protein Pmi06nite_78130 [Planotetraspora mira]
MSSVTQKVDGLAGRLDDYVEHGGSSLLGAITGKQGSGLLSAVTGRLTGGEGGKGLLQRVTDKLGAGGSSLLGAITGGEGGGHPVRAALMTYAKEKVKGIFGGGKGGTGAKGKKLKVTNIVESLDIGAPLRVVYDQWTQFEDFPSFMKKVETVEQKSDEKLGWKAQVWWSHRTWESTIVEQVPDSRIIWRSQGAKGQVDGAVTFHALTPDTTRVLLVLEYHPQGLFEHTGNLWRAQGRRARLEVKHFRRHVMTNVLLHPDETEGWRGEIRNSQVVKDHETALREEQEHEGREEEEPDEEEPERERRPAYAGAGSRARSAAGAARRPAEERRSRKPGGGETEGRQRPIRRRPHREQAPVHRRGGERGD